MVPIFRVEVVQYVLGLRTVTYRLVSTINNYNLLPGTGWLYLVYYLFFRVIPRWPNGPKYKNRLYSDIQSKWSLYRYVSGQSGTYVHV